MFIADDAAGDGDERHRDGRHRLGERDVDRAADRRRRATSYTVTPYIGSTAQTPADGHGLAAGHHHARSPA